MQIADLYLWPIAMHSFGRGGLPYEKFREAGTLIETKLNPSQIKSRGTKYSSAFGGEGWPRAERDLAERLCDVN